MGVNPFDKCREDVSIQDLGYMTNFLHKHKPETRDRLVVGIQKPDPGDMNVKFVMIPISKDVEKEYSIVMLAAEWVLEALGEKFVDTGPESV
jgi:hypothetical protein